MIEQFTQAILLTVGTAVILGMMVGCWMAITLYQKLMEALDKYLSGSTEYGYAADYDWQDDRAPAVHLKTLDD